MDNPSFVDHYPKYFPQLCWFTQGKVRTSDSRFLLPLPWSVSFPFSDMEHPIFILWLSSESSVDIELSLIWQIPESSYWILVDGLDHFSFFNILRITIPIDLHFFQRGGSTTNQDPIESYCWFPNPMANPMFFFAVFLTPRCPRWLASSWVPIHHYRG